MAADNCSGARAINVNVACDQFCFHPFNVGWAARKESGSERVIGIIRNPNCLVEVRDPNHAEDWPENFLAGKLHRWFDVSENGWRNEGPFLGKVCALESKSCFLFTYLDHLEDPLVSSSVNHWTDSDARYLGI